MTDPSSIAASLYSRQQVARLTGIDDSTLNYWMREGVLLPAEGGSGRGQHRRFAYHQVNLALLLDQLRGFGVSLPAIKRLAQRFHEAVRFFDGLGITRANSEPITDVLDLRRQLARDGAIIRHVEEENVQRANAAFPWFESKVLRRKYKHLSFEFEMSLEEAIDYTRNIHAVYGRADDKDRITDQVVALACSIDLDAYSDANRYWSNITYIDETAPENTVGSYYSPLIVYRNAEGEWEVTAGDPSSDMRSYVGVYLERLTAEAWAKL
jgi:DNA-binding transcriptional MerR regulator